MYFTFNPYEQGSHRKFVYLKIWVHWMLVQPQKNIFDTYKTCIFQFNPIFLSFQKFEKCVFPFPVFHFEPYHGNSTYALETLHINNSFEWIQKLLLKSLLHSDQKYVTVFNVLKKMSAIDKYVFLTLLFSKLLQKFNRTNMNS